MPSTAIRFLILMALLNAKASASESNHRPSSVRDPVLNLSFPMKIVALEPFPAEIRSLCVQMADNDRWVGHQWLFGVAKHSNSTYYLASGYYERPNPEPMQKRYFQPDGGGLYRVTDGKCSGDPAGEVFHVRDPAQIPLEVLEQLARDLVSRLEHAAGGPALLRAELTKQRVNFQTLSRELKEAFKPYIGDAD